MKEFQVFILRKFKPCTYNFIHLKPMAVHFSGYCQKCGWKLLGGGWYLPPVKLHNRWWFDH